MSRYILLCVTLIACALQVQAAAVIPLYDVDVVVEDRSQAARRQAFSQALAQVIDRLVGDDVWRQDPAITALLPRAERWVERYAYREVADRDGDPAEPDLLTLQGLTPVKQLMLSVTFSREAISGMLKRSGFAVWEGPRPQLVAWVLHERLAGREWLGPDDDLGRTLARQARYWGIPLIWPQSRPEVLQQVRKAEVAGGFMDSLLSAQTAFGAEGYLVLRLREIRGARTRLSGTFAVGQAPVQRLEEREGTPESLMETAMQQVSRVLSRRYAVAYDGDARHHIRMVISNVTSYHAYARTLSWLDSLPPVEQVRPVELRDTTLTVEIGLASTPGKLAEYMALRPFLQPLIPEDTQETGNPGDPELYYRYPDDAGESAP